MSFGCSGMKRRKMVSGPGVRHDAGVEREMFLSIIRRRKTERDEERGGKDNGGSDEGVKQT